MYRWLPLGTIVNNRVLVVHGGVSDSTDLDLIRSLDRGKVKIPITITYIILLLFRSIVKGKKNRNVVKWICYLGMANSFLLHCRIANGFWTL